MTNTWRTILWATATVTACIGTSSAVHHADEVRMVALTAKVSVLSSQCDAIRQKQAQDAVTMRHLVEAAHSLSQPYHGPEP
jgi:cytochrome c-type biogenesis protein CcmH/NrfF